MTQPGVPAQPNGTADLVERLRNAGCVFAEEEASLLAEAATTPEGLAELAAQRVAGRPLEHVLGWAELDGTRIGVDPGVFVPRRRSEFLVRRAARAVGVGAEDRIVLDLCAGTGALGLAVARRLTGPVTLYAVDVDPAAVSCARRNGVQHAYLGDLDAPLPNTLRGQVDLMIVSAPYVPSSRIPLMPPEARDHEARVALDGGEDGLDVVRRVATIAPEWLAPDGWLATEVGEHQGDVALAVVATAGLDAHLERCDDTDATVVLGRLPRLR